MAGNNGEECSLNGNGNGNGNGNMKKMMMMSSKREMEKEKSRMRERKRRSVTTKILDGLRKHGGYNLSPRADINDVLRALAGEAGWVVEPDGTTYRRLPEDHHFPEYRHVATHSGSDLRMYEREGNNGMPAHTCLAPIGPHLAAPSGPVPYAPPCPYPYQ